MSVNILSGFLCDQIRQENNGKYIAIGIYSSNVVFSSFPVIGSFVLFAKIQVTEAGQQRLGFRVMVGGQENHRFQGDLDFPSPSEDWIPVTLQPVQFLVPAILSIEYEKNDDWIEIFKVNIDRPPLT